MHHTRTLLLSLTLVCITALSAGVMLRSSDRSYLSKQASLNEASVPESGGTLVVVKSVQPPSVEPSAFTHVPEATSSEDVHNTSAKSERRKKAPTPKHISDTGLGSRAPSSVSKGHTLRTRAQKSQVRVAKGEQVQQKAVVPKSFETRLALAVHRLTNEKRTEVGLPPLVYDTGLAKTATRHSTDMLEREFFDHVNPDGCNIECRLRGDEYAAAAWAENIAWRLDSTMPSASELAEHFFTRWLNSHGHRINILSEVTTREGIGVARSGDRVYVTVDFSLPGRR